MLFKQFGFTPEQVVEAIDKVLARHNRAFDSR